MSEPKFEGVKMKLGGVEYIIPALSIRQIRGLQENIQTLRFDDYDGMTKIIHKAVTRNYPDMTIGELSDLVDMNNVLEITEAVTNISGLKKKIAEMVAKSAPTGTQSTAIL